MKLEKKLNMLFSDEGRQNAILILLRANSLKKSEIDFALKYSLDNNYQEAAKQLAIKKGYLELASQMDCDQINTSYQLIEDEVYDASINLKEERERNLADIQYEFENLELFCEFNKATHLAKFYDLPDLENFYSYLAKKHNFDYLKNEDVQND